MNKGENQSENLFGWPIFCLIFLFLSLVEASYFAEILAGQVLLIIIVALWTEMDFCVQISYKSLSSSRGATLLTKQTLLL